MVFGHIQKPHKKYKDLNLVIVGDGAQKKELEGVVDKLKLKKSVHFIGRVDYTDLTHYYHMADIFVSPSLSESFGKTLVEAGAAGIPAVATATTGSKEIILDGETGFVVPIKNKKQMTEKLEILLGDEDLAQKMGERAGMHIRESFDGDVNTKKIIKLWQQLTFDK